MRTGNLEVPSGQRCKALYEAACDEVRESWQDGVVLPELALSESEHDALRDYVLEQGSFLVSGRQGSVCRVRVPVDRTGGKSTSPFTQPLSQQKHHRWKLDSSQITQYALGAGRLDPERDWWEHVGLEDPTTIGVWRPSILIWFCRFLICEDLARPDPALEFDAALVAISL